MGCAKTQIGSDRPKYCCGSSEGEDHSLSISWEVLVEWMLRRYRRGSMTEATISPVILELPIDLRGRAKKTGPKPTCLHKKSQSRRRGGSPVHSRIIGVADGQEDQADQARRQRPMSKEAEVRSQDPGQGGLAYGMDASERLAATQGPPRGAMGQASTVAKPAGDLTTFQATITKHARLGRGSHVVRCDVMRYNTHR
jgi:hypothetical protein